MKTKHYPKRLKFAGEENFIVKKGRNNNYVMAISSEVSSDVVQAQTATNVDVVPLEPTTVTSPTALPKEAIVDTPPSILISSPDWASMDCDSIRKEITRLEEMLTYSKFGEDVIYQYRQIIAKGYDALAHCSKIEPSDLPPAPPVVDEQPTPKPNTTTITTTGVPIIQSSAVPIAGLKPSIGGASGGGGAKEEKKTTNWWWLVAIATGVYFLTKKD